MAMGGYGVKGGIQSLVTAMVDLATSLDVQFHFNSPVERILTEKGQTQGLQINGETIPADAVVVNADVAHLREVLAPESAKHLPKPGTASMSGYNLVVRTQPSSSRAGHNVLFPDDYLDAETVADDESVEV